MVDTIFILVSAVCYREQIAPAAERFAHSGDTVPIVKLLHKGQQRLHGLPVKENPFSITGEVFDQLQEALDILEGREFYGPSTNHVPPQPGAHTAQADLKSYVELQVYDRLFSAICVSYDQGFAPRQVLTRGRLLPYLYEHSSALEYAFTGNLRGKTLPLLPSMEVLDKSTVAELLRKLEAVPPPDDAAEDRKAQAKLEALAKNEGRVFVSSQFDDAFGPKVSQSLTDLKNLLKASQDRRGLVVIQQFE